MDDTNLNPQSAPQTPGDTPPIGSTDSPSQEINTPQDSAMLPQQPSVEAPTQPTHPNNSSDESIPELSTGGGDSGDTDGPKTANASQKSDPEDMKRKIVLAVIALLAIILPVTGYYVYTQQQTTISEAAGECGACGPPPGYQNGACSTFNPNEPPREGYCKPKSNPNSSVSRWECRPNTEAGCPLEIWQCTQVGTSGTWKLIQGCENPTPTQPQGCIPPTRCIDPNSPEGQRCGSDASQKCSLTNGGSGICCAPEEPTATPTTRPSVTPSVTPSPTPSPTTPPSVTPSVTPTPSPTNACVLSVDVEVTCIACDERVVGQ